MKTKAILTFLMVAVAAAVPFLTVPDAIPAGDGEPPPPPPPNTTLRDLPPVAVFVDSLPDNVEERGITAGVLGAHIISRLKEGGIEVVNLDPTVPTPGAPTLTAVVITLLDETVNTMICSIRFELVEAVRTERAPGVVIPATTWSISGIGVYGEDWRDRIVDDVTLYAGDFVAACAFADGEGEAR